MTKICLKEQSPHQLSIVKKMLLDIKDQNNKLKKIISKKDKTIEILGRLLEIYQTVNTKDIASLNLKESDTESHEIKTVGLTKFVGIVPDNVDDLVEFVNEDGTVKEDFLRKLNSTYGIRDEVSFDINELTRLTAISDIGPNTVCKDYESDVISETRSPSFQSDWDNIEHEDNNVIRSEENAVHSLHLESKLTEVQTWNTDQLMYEPGKSENFMDNIVTEEELFTVEDDLNVYVLHSFHMSESQIFNDRQASHKEKGKSNKNFTGKLERKIGTENKTIHSNPEVSSLQLHYQTKEEQCQSSKQSHLQCDICGKRFPLGGVWMFNKHMKVHMENSKEINKCDVCQKSFTYKSTLIAHMKAHQGNDTNSLKEVLSTTKSLVSCENCTEEFLDESSLKLHSRIHLTAQEKLYAQTKRLANPNYARPPEWRPKVRFNCKTWNLPPTLLIRVGADKKKGFTCAICQHRLYGQEKANFHIYQNHYFQLCSLAGDSIPKEIKPDFSQPMWNLEYLQKEKKIIPSK